MSSPWRSERHVLQSTNLTILTNETGNGEQEGIRHTKHNTRAHQRDHACSNRKIAADSPIAYFNTWWWPYRPKHVVTLRTFKILKTDKCLYVRLCKDRNYLTILFGMKKNCRNNRRTKLFCLCSKMAINLNSNYRDISLSSSKYKSLTISILIYG
jgi:hypothetical protein